MARDYAQRRNAGSASRGKRKPPARRQAAPPGIPGWVWMFVGIAVGVTAAAGVWILRPSDGPATVAEAPRVNTEAERRRIELPPEQPSRFSFYELLPSYEVVIPADEPARQAPRRGATEAQPAQPSALPEAGEYVIQVASFRSQGDAEAQRAQLALIGVEARVETVTIDSSQTWYRVRIGPISDPARVQSTVTRLRENGITDVMLMRVRG
jgi:cell division protein FtsN